MRKAAWNLDAGSGPPISERRIPVSDYADLLGQATARLSEQDENGNDELGEPVALERGEHFLGRWRGEITMHTKDGDAFPVYRLVGCRCCP